VCFFLDFLSLCFYFDLFLFPCFSPFLSISSSCHLGCCGCCLSIEFLLQLLHFTIIPPPYALLPIAPEFLLDKKGCMYLNYTLVTSHLSRWSALLFLPHATKLVERSPSQFGNLFLRSPFLASQSFFLLYSFRSLIYIFTYHFACGFVSS